MTLQEWIEKNKVTHAVAARRIGVSTHVIRKVLENKVITSRVAKRFEENRIEIENVKLRLEEHPIAIYKDNKIIATGTVQECADQLSKSVGTINWYLTPSAEKRWGGRGTYAIALDEPAPVLLKVEVVNKVAKKKETIVKTIRYIAKEKKGSIYLTKDCLEEVEEWMISRNFLYHIESTDKKDCLIRFKKVTL